MKHATICMGCILLALNCLPAGAGAPDGAPQLVEALLTRHGYLFKGPDRAALDGAHRLFRQANAVDRPLPNQPAQTLPEGKSADDLRQEAWDKVQGILARADMVVEVDLTGETAKVSTQEPVPQPGSAGAILYRIIRGNEGVRCVHVEHTMVMR